MNPPNQMRTYVGPADLGVRAISNDDLVRRLGRFDLTDLLLNLSKLQLMLGLGLHYDWEEVQASLVRDYCGPSHPRFQSIARAVEVGRPLVTKAPLHRMQHDVLVLMNRGAGGTRRFAEPEDRLNFIELLAVHRDRTLPASALRDPDLDGGHGVREHLVREWVLENPPRPMETFAARLADLEVIVADDDLRLAFEEVLGCRVSTYVDVLAQVAAHWLTRDFGADHQVWNDWNDLWGALSRRHDEAQLVRLSEILVCDPRRRIGKELLLDAPERTGQAFADLLAAPLWRLDDQRFEPTGALLLPPSAAGVVRMLGVDLLARTRAHLGGPARSRLSGLVGLASEDRMLTMLEQLFGSRLERFARDGKELADGAIEYPAAKLVIQAKALTRGFVEWMDRPLVAMGRVQKEIDKAIRQVIGSMRRLRREGYEGALYPVVVVPQSLPLMPELCLRVASVPVPEALAAGLPVSLVTWPELRSVEMPGCSETLPELLRGWHSARAAPGAAGFMDFSYFLHGKDLMPSDRLWLDEGMATISRLTGLSSTAAPRKV
jgi:hypothetical protein